MINKRFETNFEAFEKFAANMKQYFKSMKRFSSSEFVYFNNFFKEFVFMISDDTFKKLVCPTTVCLCLLVQTGLC